VDQERKYKSVDYIVLKLTHWDSYSASRFEPSPIVPELFQTEFILVTDAIIGLGIKEEKCGLQGTELGPEGG
jgi:hypothetical protein